MVAVAALLGNEFSEAAVMIGGAGGVLMHGAVLASGNVLQAIVGDDPDAGRLLQQNGGVAEHQEVKGRLRWAAHRGAGWTAPARRVDLLWGQGSVVLA
jgi:hypothetical protein